MSWDWGSGGHVEQGLEEQEEPEASAGAGGRRCPPAGRRWWVAKVMPSLMVEGKLEHQVPSRSRTCARGKRPGGRLRGAECLRSFRVSYCPITWPGLIA